MSKGGWQSDWQRAADEKQALVEENERLRKELAELRAAPQQPERLADIGIDFLHKWMRTGNPMLGGIAPLEMLRQGRGTKLARFIEDAYEDMQPPQKEGDL